MSQENICAACALPINDQFYLTAIDRNWHDDCLRCICCNCRLAELGWTFYWKKAMLLCCRDYIRLFGADGQCSLCMQSIGASEWIMKAGGHKVYHLHCFGCEQCHGRFCVGDQFYMQNGRILCQEDFKLFQQPNKTFF